MRRIAAAIILQKDRMLICRRKEGGNCSLLWEFPGGKVEAGESPAQCAVRECREELGVEIQLLSEYAKLEYQYEQPYEFTFFLAALKEGVPHPMVHQAIKWVTTSQLSGYDFCPANAPLLKQLQKDQ